MKTILLTILLSWNAFADVPQDYNLIYSINPIKVSTITSNSLFKIRQLPEASDTTDNFKDIVLFEKNLGLKDLFIKNIDSSLKISFFEIKIKEAGFEDVIRVSGQNGSLESHLSLKRVLSKELESITNEIKLINKGTKELSSSGLNKAFIGVDSLGCNSRGVCLLNNKKINVLSYPEIIKFLLQNRTINDLKITIKIDNFDYSNFASKQSLIENGNVVLGLDAPIFKSIMGGFSKKIIIDGTSLTVEYSSTNSNGNLFF